VTPLPWSLSHSFSLLSDVIIITIP
jgi:hypothetical protein